MLNVVILHVGGYIKLVTPSPFFHWQKIDTVILITLTLQESKVEKNKRIVRHTFLGDTNVYDISYVNI